MPYFLWEMMGYLYLCSGSNSKGSAASQKHGIGPKAKVLEQRRLNAADPINVRFPSFPSCAPSSKKK